jgi:hypothetical protein
MKRKQDEDDEEVVSHRFLEYALSGRGSCGVCAKPIQEGELRYGTKVHIPDTAVPAHDSLSFRCLSCVRRNFVSFHFDATFPDYVPAGREHSRSRSGFVDSPCQTVRADLLHHQTAICRCTNT